MSHVTRSNKPQRSREEGRGKVTASPEVFARTGTEQQERNKPDPISCWCLYCRISIDPPAPPSANHVVCASLCVLGQILPAWAEGEGGANFNLSSVHPERGLLLSRSACECRWLLNSYRSEADDASCTCCSSACSACSCWNKPTASEQGLGPSAPPPDHSR